MVLLLWLNFLTFLAALVTLWAEHAWSNYLAAMVLGWVSGAVVLVFWVLVTGLIAFHIFLICNDFTTYQYLMSNKKGKVAPETTLSNSKGEQSENTLG